MNYVERIVMSEMSRGGRVVILILTMLLSIVILIGVFLWEF